MRLKVLTFSSTLVSTKMEVLFDQTKKKMSKSKREYFFSHISDWPAYMYPNSVKPLLISSERFQAVSDSLRSQKMIESRYPLKKTHEIRGGSELGGAHPISRN